MRNVVVLSGCVPLKWHVVARHSAELCVTVLRASVRVASLKQTKAGPRISVTLFLVTLIANIKSMALPTLCMKEQPVVMSLRIRRFLTN